MIPFRLELLNFLAYRSPAPLDFSGLHVAVIAGENGAGKSSLLDAITWALWGRARARTDDELIHQSETEMRVGFAFALGDQTYQVIRQRKAGKRGGSTLDVQALHDGKWTSIAEATIPATQQKIIRLLRLTYETFVNSAYLQQGKADEFTQRRPAERKQVLADILGLKDWEEYEDRAKGKARQAEAAIATVDRSLAEIETELARRPEYENRLAEAQARALELAERLAAVEKEWGAIERAQQALSTVQRQLDDLTRRMARDEKDLRDIETELAAAQARADTAGVSQELEAIGGALARLKEREAERDTATTEREKLVKETATLRGRNEVAQAEAETAKKRVALLETATEPVCPTCGQPLSDAERNRLVAELADEVDARRELYRENKARLEALGAQLTNADRALVDLNAALREASTLEKRRAELEAALKAAGQAQADIARLTKRRERWLASLAEDRAKRAQSEIEARGYSAQLQGAAAKQAERDRLQVEHKFATEAVGAARQRLHALENLAKQREARRAERDRLAEERGWYDELREAFGKNGIPAMIIEAAVPEIEASANALLQRMTAGRMNLRINTQRETKAGQTQETLEIQISDELGTRAYEMFSGGEAFRVDFAVRIALSRLLARRAGAQLQTLIVDEGFGTQDAQGRERLVEAIHAIQDDFARILVITHIDEMKDAFPARIDVMKTAEGSQISVE